MVNSLSKMELSWICNRCCNQLIWAHFSQTSFDSESFEYFKIHGDLEEDVIRKSVPNWISYLHEFFRSFPHMLSIFLAWKMDFGFILNRISADEWGPPVIARVGPRRVLIGRAGRRRPTAVCPYKNPRSEPSCRKPPQRWVQALSFSPMVARSERCRHPIVKPV
jgi:hypothetical protein